MPPNLLLISVVTLRPTQSMASISALIMLQILSYFLGSVFFLTAYGVFATPEYVLNAGPSRKGVSWSPLQQCPPDTFIRALDTTEYAYESPSLDDDLGLIHVLFECVAVDGTVGGYIGTLVDGIELERPVSTQFKDSHSPLHAERGSHTRDGWMPPTPIPVSYALPLRTRCPTLAVGLQISVQPEQGTRDDVGFNGVRLLCAEGLVADGYTTTASNEHSELDWQPAATCKKRHALCGIETGSVPLDHEDLDHVAIQSLRLKCCPVPNPAEACTPSASWEKIEHSLPSRTPDLLCSYTSPLRFGVEVNPALSQADFDAGEEEAREMYEALGFELQTDTSYTSGALHRNMAKLPNEGDFVWAEAASRAWLPSSSSTTLAVAPFSCGGEASASKTVRIYQLVGSCGWFSVRTGKFRRVDETRRPADGELIDEKEYFYGN